VDIVIAGGGTAGWISAYIIEQAQPSVHNITVVESSSIGIVGAGEGSTGSLNDLVSGYSFGKYREQNIKEFMDFTDSTPKFGIYHLNWSTTKNEGYFAPIDAGPTSSFAPDTVTNYVISNYGPESAVFASYYGQSYATDRFPSGDTHAFHFDAFKVGKYFRQKLESLPNFSVIDSIIKNVQLTANGEIDSLRVEDDRIISGDFFIDCTGFSKVLISKLGTRWLSYKENLTVDRAMPFVVNYNKSSIEKQKPLTTARALSSGWMWDIPLKTRRGCGYVYNSDFLSEDQAQKEIEETLGHQIEPIRHLNFDAGRSEQLWNKNCLASGLSAAFMEPLEATSIHTTIQQMMFFVMGYLQPTKEATVQEHKMNSYNKKFEALYDTYRDFLNLHYQGGRTDSEFWKYLSSGVTMTPFVKEIISCAKTGLPSFIEYENKFGSSTILWNWILIGLGMVPASSAAQQLKIYDKEKEAAEAYNWLLNDSRQKNRNQKSFSLWDNEQIKIV
jgi:tryptophan halogenase